MRAYKAPLSAILPCAPNTAGANKDRTPSEGLSGIFHGAVPQKNCRNICAAGAAESVGHSKWLTFCDLRFSQGLCFGVAGDSFGRCCLSSSSIPPAGCQPVCTMYGAISPQLPVILRIAVRTFLIFCESIHAITTSSPDIFIRGSPLEVSATTISGALAPSGLTTRDRTSAPPGVLSTQLTKAFPEERAMTAARPIGFPALTRISGPKVTPPSTESAA